MFDFSSFAALYKKQLLEQVIPFWEKHSIDQQCGGFFTCLDQKGKLYDTDKFVWPQARQVWLFSILYNQLQKEENWLKIALHGADFLAKHGRDPEGRWYFSLTRQGKPLVEPYSIFSDCFAAMAFSELYKATHVQSYKEIAVQTFRSILKRQENPLGKWSKAGEGRQLKNFTLPMILCNLGLIVQNVVGEEEVNALLKPIVQTIMNEFLDKQHNLLFQNRGPKGQFVDCHEGRVINPGHGTQAIWFLLDLAERFKDEPLKHKCTDILLNTIKFAWDQQMGGLFYFKDIKGYPPQQLQWDQKLWWVQLETMIALLKAYKATGRAQCLQWFRKFHDYCWKSYRDSENGGEWWGYLNRRGQVLLRLKGGKWKGCFHLPRALYQIFRTCEQLQP